MTMTKPAIIFVVVVVVVVVEYLRENGRKKKAKRVELPRLCILLYLIMVQSDLVEKAKIHAECCKGNGDRKEKKLYRSYWNVKYTMTKYKHLP